MEYINQNNDTDDLVQGCSNPINALDLLQSSSIHLAHSAE